MSRPQRQWKHTAKAASHQSSRAVVIRLPTTAPSSQQQCPHSAEHSLRIDDRRTCLSALTIGACHEQRGCVIMALLPMASGAVQCSIGLELLEHRRLIVRQQSRSTRLHTHQGSS